MNTFFEKSLKALAAAGGAIAGLLGGWDALLRVLVGMMAADYLSGVVVAALGKSPKTDYGGLSSKVGAAGILRKGLMLTVVLSAALLDTAMGETNMCRDAACWFYIANEGLSLLENLGLMGVPFPEKLKLLLGQHLSEGGSADGSDA